MRICRAVSGALAAAAVLALAAAPAGATYKGRNGRVALAWLDNDQGAHFEADYAIVTVPWLRGDSTGRNVVSCTSLDGCPQFSRPAYSPSGSQIVYTNLPFAASAPQPKSELVLADADGSNKETITDPARNLFDASFMPSGRRLLFVQSPTASPGGERPQEGQIVTMALLPPSSPDGPEPLKTVTSIQGAHPKASPNGRTVLFDHAGAIWAVGAGGANPHRLIKNATMPDWSPDGRSIVYVSGNYPKGKHLLFVARANGTHPRQITGTLPHRRSGPLRDVDDPVFSPDGKQIAFSTIYYDGSGDPYLFRVPARGGRVKQLWTTPSLDAGGTDLGTSWQPLP